MNKSAILLGSIFAMTGVILGAFGAHYLKTIFTPELLTSFETGVRYQMYHAFALLISGILASFFQTKLNAIIWLFSLGILLFSGSIYTLCIIKGTMQIGLGGLGILTPIGGVLLIAAWGLLAYKALTFKK
jgi:uncharacterized membrane protein YgdD (TMEM256/DUF423 family)